MNEIDAMNLVRGKLEGYRVKKVKETPEVYLYMCEYPDPEYVPSKLAVAVNKKNSRLDLLFIVMKRRSDLQSNIFEKSKLK